MHKSCNYSILNGGRSEPCTQSTRIDNIHRGLGAGYREGLPLVIRPGAVATDADIFIVATRRAVTYTDSDVILVDFVMHDPS